MHYRCNTCQEVCNCECLSDMIEDAIKSGVTLIRDMPHCSFCSVRGKWTDEEPIFEKHKDTCLITKYNNYLRGE